MLNIKGYGHLPMPCQTCYFRDYAGDMVDPCFPRELGGFGLFGKQRKFQMWTDGKLSPDQLYKWERYKYDKMNEILDNDPEFQELMQNLLEEILRE